MTSFGIYIQVPQERNSTPTRREPRLGDVLQGMSKSKFSIKLSFSLNLPLVFIFKCNFDKFQNQPPGEPRENYRC